MSKTNFTPGPWQVCEDMVSVHSPKKDIVVSTYIDEPHFAPETQDELEANAALISAAPEMYESLKNIQRYLERSGESYLLEQFGVNQSLEKARGEI